MSNTCNSISEIQIFCTSHSDYNVLCSTIIGEFLCTLDSESVRNEESIEDRMVNIPEEGKVDNTLEFAM